MVPYTLITFYIERKFKLPEGKLGTIISAAQFMSSMGNIFASAVAKRIGLVRAMVYTHLPSAILLALIPAPPWLVLTVIILVLRASLASMDQAPRSAFLSAVVLPEERTATMGIVNTVKTMSQSSGPLITGVLADKGRFWIAFVIAGTLKASYDLGMLKMFVNTKLEGDKAPSADVANIGGHGERNESRLAAENSQDGEDLELENVKP
jgi:MFS family permease